MGTVAVLTVIIAALGSAQDQPKFEVASVKIAPPKDSAMMKCSGGPGSADPERVTCSNAALSMLVCVAYNVQFYQIKGPDWMNWGGSTGGYDIVAKIPEGTTKAQYRLMFQELLTERFHLVMHHETKEVSQYSLRLGKSPKVMPSSGTSSSSSKPVVVNPVKEHLLIEVHRAPLATLVGMLTMYAASTVVDETGLKGDYDFTLEFAPDERFRGFHATSGADDAPGLEAAIRDQLGLKLEKTKGTLDVLVVDRADKTPTEN